MSNQYNKLVIERLCLNTQENILFKSLEKYYTENIANLLILNDIINGTNCISRRTIEYFVTNYTSENIINLEYKKDDNTNITFNVYTSYKEQLKAHKKKYFDPFGRGLRIPFFINDICIITTIGQLNFYRWFFSKNIYDYCFKNYKKIQTALLGKKKVRKNKSGISIIKKNTVDYIEAKKSLQSDLFTISFNI